MRRAVCTPKPDIRRRKLIGTAESRRLEATFKTLANRHYRIVDPCVTSLLDRAWCLAEDAEARAR